MKSNYWIKNKLTKAITIADEVWEELDPKTQSNELEQLEEILFELGQLRDKFGELEDQVWNAGSK